MATLSSKQHEEVLEMYKSGLSAQQIADHLKVSIGAIYYPLRRSKVPRRTLKEASRVRFEAKALSYSIKRRLTAKEEQLKLAGVLLYWAEGYKVGRQTVIDFANSDPEMAVIFTKFLREICGVNETRLRCSLYCYEGQDIDSIKSYWSGVLNIPEKYFTKPYIKAGAPGSQGPRMTRGLVHVRYCDKKLLRQILNWIEEYKQKCVGGRVVNCTRL